MRIMENPLSPYDIARRYMIVSEFIGEGISMYTCTCEERAERKLKAQNTFG